MAIATDVFSTPHENLTTQFSVVFFPGAKTVMERVLSRVAGTRAEAGMSGGQIAGTPSLAVSQPAVLSALQRLEELASLGPNWDSYNADPLSPTAVAHVRELLSEVDRWFRYFTPPLAAQSLSVAPVADGGVALEWQSPRRELEVEIGPDGRCTYLLIDNTEDGPRYTEKANVAFTEVLNRVLEVFSTQARA